MSTTIEDTQPAPNASPADLTRRSAEAIRLRDARARRSMKAMQTALLALIEERPFGKITVEDIAARAGTGRSTFYRYYATKEALLDEIATVEIEELFALTFPLLDTSGTRASSLALAKYVDARRKLWTVLLTGGASAVMRAAFVKLAIDSAQNATFANTDIPVELGAVFGVAATIEILSWWLRQPQPVSVDDVAGFLDRLAVRPSLTRG